MVMMWIILALNFIVSIKWVLAISLFIYYFRQELRAIFKVLPDVIKGTMDKLKSFKSRAGELTFFESNLGSELNLSKSENTYNKSAEGYNKGFGPFELQTVVEEGNIIEKQIIDKKCSEADAIGLLIYSLAHQNLRNRFLIFDRFITTAQISALEYLNASILPIPTDKFKKFCDELAGKEDGYTYDSFVRWMTDWKLIEKTSLGFVIALHGRDYLSFRARAGSNSLKPISKPWQEIAASLN